MYGPDERSLTPLETATGGRRIFFVNEKRFETIADAREHIQTIADRFPSARIVTLLSPERS